MLGALLQSLPQDGGAEAGRSWGSCPRNSRAKLGSLLGCQVPKPVLSSSRTSVRNTENSDKGGREGGARVGGWGWGRGKGREGRGEKDSPEPAGQLPPLPSPSLQPTPVLRGVGAASLLTQISHSDSPGKGHHSTALGSFADCQDQLVF